MLVEEIKYAEIMAFGKHGELDTEDSLAEEKDEDVDDEVAEEEEEEEEEKEKDDWN